MVRSLDCILFLSVYNTKGRVHSAKLVWLLVMRFGGMPLEQMEVFLFSDPSLGASTGRRWNVTQSSLDQSRLLKEGEMHNSETGQGRHFHTKEKEKPPIPYVPWSALGARVICVSVMTSPSRHVSRGGHREMGACCEVQAVSHFWAESGEHSS